MAKFTVGKGMDEYLGQLDQLNLASEEMIGRAIYPGAKIVTDEIRKNIEELPTNDTGWYTGSSDHKISAITKSQKKGLLDGLGIARKRNDNGYINVKVGMDGYNSTKTNKYPQGQPNAMIARSIESGTSFRSKHPFIAPAVRSKKIAAEMAMAEEFDIETKKIFT